MICFYIDNLSEKDTLIIMKIDKGQKKGVYIDNLSKKKGIEFEFLKKKGEKYVVKSVVQNVEIRKNTYNIIVIGDLNEYR